MYNNIYSISKLGKRLYMTYNARQALLLGRKSGINFFY